MIALFPIAYDPYLVGMVRSELGIFQIYCQNTQRTHLGEPDPCSAAAIWGLAHPPSGVDRVLHQPSPGPLGGLNLASRLNGCLDASVSCSGGERHSQSPAAARTSPLSDSRATTSTAPPADKGFAGFLLTASSYRTRSGIAIAGLRTTAKGMPPPTGRAITNSTASWGGIWASSIATSMACP